MLRKLLSDKKFNTCVGKYVCSVQFLIITQLSWHLENISSLKINLKFSQTIQLNIKTISYVNLNNN